MEWQFRNDIPIYTQLIEQIKQRIVSGVFAPGQRLPAVREFALDAGVNPNTMQRALAELERESILERQREGIEIAKAEGKYKGRKPVAVNEAKFRAVCARWRAGEITATTAMQEVGLKPNTFYRRVKELNL